MWGKMNVRELFLDGLDDLAICARLARVSMQDPLVVTLYRLWLCSKPP